MVSGARTPLLLIPVADHDAFRSITREFAAAVAQSGGIDRLRLGPGLTTGIVNLMIVGIPGALLFAYLLYVSISDGGWWWVASAAIFALFLWFGGRNIVSRWPRRIRRLEQLDAELEER